MPPSSLMQKLRKNHAKQMKKMKPGARNNANVRPTPRPKSTTANRNLNAAVAKMKAVQKKFNDNRNARIIKVIAKK